MKPIEHRHLGPSSIHGDEASGDVLGDRGFQLILTRDANLVDLRGCHHPPSLALRGTGDFLGISPAYPPSFAFPCISRNGSCQPL
jgi:hypothetical protein